MERHLTIKDAARALAISERTVARLIRSGRIAVRRIGRLVRIPESTVDRLLNGQTYFPPEHRPYRGRGKELFPWQR